MDLRKFLPVACVMALLAGILPGCSLFRTRPEMERQAISGMKAAQPVIEALERYHLRHKHYPLHLNLLVPDYLGQKRLWEELFYSAFDSTFTLSFDWQGRGLSHCIYAPGKNWRCYTKY